MKFFMINNTFDNVYYAYDAWVGSDSREEAPVLFVTREEANKFLAKKKYYLEEKDDHWVMAEVVEVEIN